MNNNIQRLHNLLSYIPFLWLSIFILIVFLGYLKVGHLPHYGKEIINGIVIDPSQLTFGIPLSLFNLSFFLLSIPCVILWPIISLYLMFSHTTKTRYFYRNILLFFISIFGYYIINNFLNYLMTWVFD